MKSVVPNAPSVLHFHPAPAHTPLPLCRPTVNALGLSLIPFQCVCAPRRERSDVKACDTHVSSSSYADTHVSSSHILPLGDQCMGSIKKELTSGKRVFVTNVKGTFFGMSESEEASKS